MSIVRISSTLTSDQDFFQKTIQALRDFFDRVEPLDIISGEDPLYRVSKDSMNIIFNDDTNIDVGIRKIPESILNSTTTKYHFEVTEINGVGLENKNYGPDKDDSVEYFWLNLLLYGYF